MKKRDTISSLGAAFFALCLFCSCAAGSAGGRLDGVWMETEQFGNHPRTVLHFKGKTLRFENLFGASDTVEYRVKEKDDDGVTIGIEYTHMVKKPGGRMVERTERREFLLHLENGRPILSEKEFEADGRGPIIMSEYLRKEDFVDGFRSERKRRLNDRPAAPTMMRE